MINAKATNKSGVTGGKNRKSLLTRNEYVIKIST
jgi:hypothetical protein